jgi:parallel beta-helix repeat protein
MHKKQFLRSFSLILIISVILITANTKSSSPERQLETIFIRPDGSIHPPSSPIIRNGDMYTFTGDVYAVMKIQKSNIILDGAGYCLQGPYNGTQADVWVIGEGSDQLPEGVLAEYTIGIDLSSRNVEGIVIKNLNIKNFSIGMYMWTKNISITGNAITENIVGILLSGSNTTIMNNYIANNKQGLFFGFNSPSEIPTDIYIWQNGFVDNVMQLNGCLCDEYPEDEEPHAWDDGKVGNYWSDYIGVDANNDGIGDSPYVIDIQNQDRFPLMHNPAKPPISGRQQFPIEVTVITVFMSSLIAISLVTLMYRKKHK